MKGNYEELKDFVYNGEQLKLEEDQWKELLTEWQFYILREKGTERAFTGKYYLNKEEGVYVCSGCGLPLFLSETKYPSGSGWPSFFAPIQKENEPPRIREALDTSYGMFRMEILCSRCGGHLGHVFPDGPKPTGLRYCVNSASIFFIPKKK
ncbi:MAG: peptide-methionine (R)-S-oxide reductase MsrB [Leptospiraceae bacterium]|nr:peptide-methionine (R)-S-oxide reductase MsrB [Leptospiraceae bacterium]MDW7975385.1 peptide-methionine (R)-S-oxide reductase MsrB [Leptospiraceae bacterium]